MNLILDCSRERKPEVIDWRTLSVGTVFEYIDGAKGIVFSDYYKEAKGVLVLNRAHSKDMFLETAAGYLDMKIKRVLGCINSIEIKE